MAPETTLTTAPCPLRHHGAQGGHAAIHRPENVDSHRTLDRFDSLARRMAGTQHSGVVDQAVDVAERLHRGRHDRLARLWIRDGTHEHRDGTAPRRDQFRGHANALSIDVVHEYRSAGGGHGERVRSPEARAGSGDGHNPALKQSWHPLAPDSAEPFEDHGHALATGGTHRLDGELLVALLQGVDRGRGDPRPGHPERMSQRDRSAIDIDPVEVDPDVIDAGKHLGRERLIDLHEIDVTDRELRELERVSHGIDGSEAHDLGAHRGDGR